MSSAAVNSGPSGFLPTFRDLIALTKPRVSTLVLATAACGIGLAPGKISAGSVVLMLLGTLLCVGSANALNCYLERDTDKRMRRTSARPLPAGRLDPNLALIFGLFLGVASIPVLALGANFVTGVLGLVALASYVMIYTPMKTQSPLALIVGAVPGALPPLMGYAAVTGQIAPKGLLLFAFSFLWQIPHVIGLAAYRRDEYVAAGIKVVPAVYSPRVVRLYAISAALLLTAFSSLPAVFGWAGPRYLVVALLLGAAYVGAALRTLREDATTPLAVWGRRLFLVSLVYLPSLFVALLLDGRG
ncbi:MAG TPA: heme o synthase [Polyangiales bacterium]|nr:heme o synthase [Polyangiales bacterium]